MSDNHSVEDEITRETSRTMGKIMAAARSWIGSHRARGGTTKLTRKERRELAAAVQQQVGEQRIAEAWYTKRVDDYHAEVVAANRDRRSPGFTAAHARASDDRLSRIRYAIESGTHASRLPIEQRGQVALALSRVEQHPGRPFGAVFAPMTAEQARTARAAAVRSETWVHARREANERQLAEQRHREQARLNARPPLAYEAMNAEQQDAVQALRGAEISLRLMEGSSDTARIAELDRDMRAAARDVRAVGLPLSQVAHERDTILDNARFETSVYGSPHDHGRVHSWHASEAEALKHADRRVQEMADSPAGYSVYVTPWDGLKPGEFVREARGDREFASTMIAQWSADQASGWPEPTADAQLTTIAVYSIDPATGRDTRVEQVTVRTDVPGAVEHAQRTVEMIDWKAGEVAEVRIDDAEYDGYDEEYDTSLYRDHGSPAHVESKLVAERVRWHDRAATEAQAATVRAVAERDGVQQRLNLSIEHNGELTDRNAELTRQLAALTAERDEATAERDRLRGERDEAVHKLAERTPAEKRFGSPERQAASSAAAANQPREKASSSSSNALADALARQAEREGTER